MPNDAHEVAPPPVPEEPTLLTAPAGPTVSAWSTHPPPPEVPPPAPPPARGVRIPMTLLLAFGLACVCFAVALTWNAFYQQHRMDAGLQILDARIDKLADMQGAIVREQARRQGSVERIPALEAFMFAQQGDSSRLVAAVRAVEVLQVAQALRLAEFQKQVEVLRTRMDDLLYVKRLHPPPKKERPDAEP